MVSTHDDWWLVSRAWQSIARVPIPAFDWPNLNLSYLPIGGFTSPAVLFSTTESDNALSLLLVPKSFSFACDSC